MGVGKCDIKGGRGWPYRVCLKKGLKPSAHYAKLKFYNFGKKVLWVVHYFFKMDLILEQTTTACPSKKVYLSLKVNIQHFLSTKIIKYIQI